MVAFFEILVAMYIVMALHELGHFLTAYAFKLPISSFEVGVGPRLFQFMWKGMWFRYYLFPVMGIVHVCWGSKNRWKNIALFAAGPIANLLTALVVYLFYYNASGVFFKALFWLSMYIGILNSLPFKTTYFNSDGFEVLRILRLIRTSA